MFFRVHEEGKIGYKQLTKTDLGDSKGNTTHIGLFGDILQFLPDKDHDNTSMFIFNNECMSLGFSFDRIRRASGKFNSPKIKKGGRDVASVVTVICDIYKTFPNTYNWYLLWFGLESEEAVFYLFNDHSQDYEMISKIIPLTIDCKGRVVKDDNNFGEIIKYLETIINNNNQELISELEIVSQTGNDFYRFRKFDIDKANRLFKEIGDKGEMLVAAHLDILKQQGRIVHYTWLNQSSESGLPYDFIIQELGQNIIHMDVKSTSFKFEQPMIFSSQEINFISKVPYYQIYRAYSLSEQNNYLKICHNSKEFMPQLKSNIDNFSEKLQSCNIKLQTAKLAVPTLHEKLQFGQEIKLM